VPKPPPQKRAAILPSAGNFSPELASIFYRRSKSRIADAQALVTGAVAST
jgi:hypothetical protein